MSETSGPTDPAASAAPAPADQPPQRPAQPANTKKSRPPKAGKTATPQQQERREIIVRFAIFIAVGAVLTVVLYFLLSTFIPRWWGQLIGRQVSGRISTGILLGLIYGFVFSFLPLIVLAQARHRAFTWPSKVIIILIAAALTAPNLMTLGVAIGTGKAAQAGNRTMDVNAPGFRYASVWGVVFGVITAIVVVTVSILWDRRSQELKVLRARVKDLEAELPPTLPVPAESTTRSTNPPRRTPKA